MIDRQYAGKVIADSILQLCRAALGSKSTTISELLISKFDWVRQTLYSHCVWNIWEDLLGSCMTYDPQATPLLSEKALASLIRKGISKGDLSFSSTIAYVRLPHLSYRIRKDGPGFTSGPDLKSCVDRPSQTQMITLSGEDFADFLLEFDSLIGQVDKKLDEAIMEYRIKAAQYDIIRQAVDTLGEELLKPSGIRWEVGKDFTESSANVTFSDKEHEPLCKVIPMDALADVIRTVPETMRHRRKLPKKVYRQDPSSDDDDLNSVFP